MKKASLFTLLIAVILLVCLYTFCKYDYAFSEQFSLFVLSKSYFHEIVMVPGGLLKYIATFFLQFFYYLIVGPLYTTLLCIGIFFAAYNYFLNTCKRNISFIFAATIAFSCVCLSIDPFYGLEGNLAVLVCFTEAILLRRITKTALSITATIVCSVLTYLLCGPIAILLALLVVIENINKKTPYKLFYLLPIILIVGLIIYLQKSGAMGDVRHLALPDCYYHEFIQAPHTIYLPWLLIIAFAVISKLSNITPLLFREFGEKIQYAIQGTFCAILFAVFFCFIHQSEIYQAKKLEVMRWHNQWGRILLETSSAQPSSNMLWYSNLALAKKGWLGENLFSVPQYSAQGLITKWDGSQSQADLFAEIYMTMGDVAMAQKMAFNASVLNKRFINGRLLLLLAKTNMIYGHYKVADKYISILEKTLFYSSSASHLRSILTEGVSGKEPDIDALSKTVKNIKQDFADTNTDNLEAIAKANPNNRTILEYYGAKLLLQGELPAFETFIRENKHFLLKPKMPKAFQEALLMVIPEEEWNEFGVEDNCKKEFKQFCEIVERYGSNNAANYFSTKMQHTFWYYSLMFSNNK